MEYSCEKPETRKETPLKIARYIHESRVNFGIVEDGQVQELKSPPFSGIESSQKSYPLTNVIMLPPVEPTKIIGVGLNYADHARELGLKPPETPPLFMKPPSSLIAHGEEITYPRASVELNYEAELAIICGTRCKDVSIESARHNIFGYTCANDITARDLQRLDGQWTRAKGFDTFCPLGPFTSTDLNPNNLRVELKLNGQLRQSSTTKNMIFSCSEIFSYVSHIMTLNPGDVILTGTPPGVGFLKVGDAVEVEIENIGVLSNTVQHF